MAQSVEQRRESNRISQQKSRAKVKANDPQKYQRLKDQNMKWYYANHTKNKRRQILYQREWRRRRRANANSIYSGRDLYTIIRQPAPPAFWCSRQVDAQRRYYIKSSNTKSTTSKQPIVRRKMSSTSKIHLMTKIRRR